MLVLTRKLGEFLILNDNIFISVFEGGNGDQVKIAIEAPEDVKIARSEMFADCEEIQQKLEAIRSKRWASGPNGPAGRWSGWALPKSPPPWHPPNDPRGGFRPKSVFNPAQSSARSGGRGLKKYYFEQPMLL